MLAALILAPLTAVAAPSRLMARPPVPAPPVPAPPVPSHVVSLNLCADQYLVRLAPGRIAALSPLARDPRLSMVAEPAARLPVVRADAEAVLRLAPDLVLAGPFAARATTTALEAQGVTVAMLAMPQDFPAIRAETERLGALLGAPGAARAWLDAMAADLAHGGPGHARALIWEPRGWTAGPGSLGDAVLRAAGDTNLGTGGRIGLEALLAHPPGLLVTATDAAFPSLATDLLRHPAIARLPRLALPPALLVCGTPDTARAVALLRR